MHASWCVWGTFFFSCRRRHTRCALVTGVQRVLVRSLIVQSPIGDFSVRPAQATDDTAGIGTVAVVLLCVKPYQLGPAIAALPPLVGSETDRNSVVLGKSVSGRVELGSRPLMQKKRTTQYIDRRHTSVIQKQPKN